MIKNIFVSRYFLFFASLFHLTFTVDYFFLISVKNRFNFFWIASYFTNNDTLIILQFRMRENNSNWTHKSKLPIEFLFGVLWFIDSSLAVQCVFVRWRNLPPGAAIMEFIITIFTFKSFGMFSWNDIEKKNKMWLLLHKNY